MQTRLPPSAGRLAYVTAGKNKNKGLVFPDGMKLSVVGTRVHIRFLAARVLRVATPLRSV